MGANRLVHIMFMAGAVAIAVICGKLADWVLGFVMVKPPQLPVAIGAVVVGCVGAFLLYRNERVLELATDVSSELWKVTWPSRQEIKTATIVVVVTVLVFSVVLGLYDAFWSWVTTYIYK